MPNILIIGCDGQLMAALSCCIPCGVRPPFGLTCTIEKHRQRLFQIPVPSTMIRVCFLRCNGLSVKVTPTAFVTTSVVAWLLDGLLALSGATSLTTWVPFDTPRSAFRSKFRIALLTPSVVPMRTGAALTVNWLTSNWRSGLTAEGKQHPGVANSQPQCEPTGLRSCFHFWENEAGLRHLKRSHDPCPPSPTWSHPGCDCPLLSPPTPS